MVYGPRSCYKSYRTTETCRPFVLAISIMDEYDDNDLFLDILLLDHILLIHNWLIASYNYAFLSI